MRIRSKPPPQATFLIEERYAKAYGGHAQPPEQYPHSGALLRGLVWRAPGHRMHELYSGPPPDDPDFCYILRVRVLRLAPGGDSLCRRAARCPIKTARRSR